ncbi:LacI family DNA-binding transcriptional regulator [Paenibacillus cremeus]|uniref:LacI family transcriptional regulator n=1 Tax=Paenibacillus cremeus TaxID=2163881 RepID=A0A559KEA7_9BACL|nr:LacI family DNA-binding transcriptional regulator [Paenibacillus cremeus]TVY10443.1 LacI family transcriptional regulator [Paenibacillus cremeus]
MDQFKSKVTIDQVAKAAGVAKSTVSRIINNAPGVKPATKMRVSKIIEEMGFTPNLMARSLKTNLRKQIALAINDIRNPYYPELAWAAEQVAKQHGYRLVLINHYGNPSDELAVVREANDMHVDGIIMLPLSKPKTLMAEVKKASVPVCLIGVYEEDIPADSVALTRSEGVLAMEHLIRIGRQRIAYVGRHYQQFRPRSRFSVYQKALESSFLKRDPAHVFLGPTASIQTGLEAAHYFYSLKDKDNLPDAVFTDNDMTAIGLIQGLLNLGVRVPEDIAVVGVDDINWCTLITPKLTSVSSLSTEMGRIAVELLLKRIETGPETEFRRVELEPRLIVRESSVKQL